MKALVAKDIMTPNVIEVPASWSIHRLAEFFIENSISGAPVISENGELMGVVTSTDIIQSDLQHEKDPESAYPPGYYLHSLENRYTKAEIASLKIESEPLITVGDIMTPMVFEVFEQTPVQKIADQMIKHCIHRIFVTKNAKITGIISSVDMLKIIRDM